MDTLRNWLMVFLASVFILSYCAVLLGWLRPLSDVGMVYRLEPIIFIIVGYYVGKTAGRRDQGMSRLEITHRKTGS